ncbi:MAG: ABC transporter permease [Ilumatobacter sp.]|jgi:peptide/nickel transport system permease protein|uniref:ABC transporter permease n=1 Tax=Ilumatobacter sp. TaxID=1967498 RepID=UPI00391B3034
MVYLKRFGRLVFVFFVVTFFTFFLLDQSPGDPAVRAAGLNATPETIEAKRIELGLDASLVERYLRWLGDALRFDFGDSIVIDGFSAWDLIRESLPKTLEIMVLAEIIAIAIAVPLAIASARHPGGVIDKLSSTTAFGLLALPSFVLGIYMSFIFGVQLGWFPTIVDNLPGFNDDPIENLRQMFLPSLTLALNLVAVYLRLLRSDLIDTLQEDYVMLAQARGLSERRVMWRHVLRPSSVNFTTAVGLNIAGLIGGTLIIEVLFAINGMGRLIIQSVILEDFNVVAAAVAILTVAYVSLNFVVDLLYSVLDPRIRHGAR